MTLRYCVLLFMVALPLPVLSGCGGSKPTAVPSKDEAAKTPTPPSPKGAQNAKTISD